MGTASQSLHAKMNILQSVVGKSALPIEFTINKTLL